jgi:putative pyoverdin transport system ATP-binding/permease protein
MRELLRLVSFLIRLCKGIPHARWALTLITLAGIAGGVASTALIALTASILNRAGNPPPLLVATFVGLCVALPICRFLSQVFLLRLSQKALLSLRVRLSGQVLAAPLKQLEALGAPRLLATLTNDITLIIDSIGSVPLLCMNLAVLASCLCYLGWLSITMLLEVLVFIVIGILAYQLPLIKALRHYQQSRLLLDQVTGQVRAITEGTKELKMHRARRASFLEAVHASTDLYQTEYRKGSVLLAAGASMGQVLFFIVLGLLVLLLPQIQHVDRKILLSYTIVLFQILATLEVVLTTLPFFSRASIATKTVEDLGFSLQSEAVAPQSAPPRPWRQLELSGIRHSYYKENEAESFQLGSIDAVFERGETIFLVGGNGSGKTTLAKLLVGLYVPEAGEIRLDGRPVRAQDLDDYRELWSVVFADFFLFDQLFGLAAAGGELDQQAHRYLQRLKLDRKVQIAHGTLSTIDLSQGQRKRLALLTAYLEDRPIYLFDEWAADQDPVFKAIFYLEILPELKQRGKTVFVISHDDHYFHVADRILKLDYGRIESDQQTAAHTPHLSPDPSLALRG